MPRYYVKNKKDKWNIFSSIVDDYILDNFVTFEELKDYAIKRKVEEYSKELDSLLTDRPELNVMGYEEAEEIIEFRKNEELESED